MRNLKFLLSLFLLSLLSLPALAQTYTASLRGIVTDSSKAAVPSASVVLTEVDQHVKHTTVTDGSGRYVLTAIPPGRYSLSVEMAGFQKSEVPVFKLEVQQTSTIDVELKVGQTTTTVEITASAPMLNTTSANLGQVIENKFIQTQPLAGRNPLALVTLTAGLVPTETEAGGTASTNFVANGTRNSTAEVVLDGAAVSGMEQNGGITEVKYTPSVDTLDEFKVQTSYFSAEFGNTGGAIVNMVSKSGTNEFHGVGYWFRRDAVLNANDFFANREGWGKTDGKNDVFGYTVGGPVILPKLYNGRNRTFFFFDFEDSRSKGPTSMLTTVPTDLERKGDFSETYHLNSEGGYSQYTVYNPFATYTNADGQTVRQPFDGNVVPVSMQSAVAKKILGYYPAATSAGDAYTHANNYYARGVQSGTSDQFDIKLDHNISEKTRLTSRYSAKWNGGDPVNLLGNVAADINNFNSRQQNFVFDVTRTQSATTIFNVRISLMRNHLMNDPVSTGFNGSSELGLSSLFNASTIYQFPSIQVDGYQSLGSGGWAIMHQAEDIGLVSGSMTKVMGAHTFKTGAEFRRYRENYFQPGYPSGYLSFGRGATEEDPLSSAEGQGNGVAGLLLGWGTEGGTDVDYAAATASGYFGTYLQDEWRISPKLTLSLGVRYDFDIPRTERFNRLNWFNYDAASPISGQVPGYNLKGAMEYATSSNRSPYNGDYNNFQPRVGLAYALGNKTSLRAGYGIYYSASRASIKGEIGPAFRSGTGVEFSRDSGLTQYASLDNPFPNGLVAAPGAVSTAFLGLDAGGYDPNAINPQYQQWSFSIQRELPGNGVLEVNYTGSKGTHLSFGSDDLLGNGNKLDPSYYSLGRDTLTSMVANPFYGVITNPNSPLSAETIQYNQLLRAYPQYYSIGGYTAAPYIGNSHYHAVQFKYEKRFSHGMAFLAHYTISKLISDSDSPGTDIDWLGGSTGMQNWKDLRQERSLASFDIPQRAVLSFNYQLPVGRGRRFGAKMNKVLDGAVGGWEVSSILTFSSGYPIVNRLANTDLWEGTQRPNVTGESLCTSGSPSSRLDQYLNPGAFSQPDQDVYGTASRTSATCRTFGIRNMDVTLMKNFKFSEHKSLQFRVEGFNATNTPTFGRPDESWGSDTFGQINGYASGRGARELQLAVKFYY
jgi:hypothetical protein